MKTPSEEKLKEIQTTASKQLEDISTLESLESWRVSFIGRKGQLSLLLRSIKELAPEQKKIIGQLGNAIRQKLESGYEEKAALLQPANVDTQASQESASDNKTMLNGLPKPGHLHPITQAIRQVQQTLTSLGFVLADGPLAEEARYNFDLLNIPVEHPSRAETDTFYINPEILLRTSTSPVQVRSVLELGLKPPLRVFSPGRVFRSEKLDPTHSHTFHQIEGLAIDTDITIAHFRFVVEKLYSDLLGDEVATRLRPHYFPFVEPGFEVDISCVFCAQKGCRICSQTGWIEVLGAGMVHPNVLRNMNLDPKKYQGFAFGGGIDRVVMLKHGIDDLRLLWSGKLSFLNQF